MNARIRTLLVLLPCVLPGCLALKSDLDGTETHLTARINQVEENLGKQNSSVLNGDAEALATQVALGKQQAEAALQTSRDNERRQLESERSIAALTSQAANFVTGGRVSELTSQIDGLKSASGGLSGGELITTLISSALAAVGGGLLGKTGKSRAQPQIDELFDKTERLGQVMAASNPAALAQIVPPPAKAA